MSRSVNVVSNVELDLLRFSVKMKLTITTLTEDKFELDVKA